MANLSHFTKGNRNCFRLRFYINKRRYHVGLGSFTEAQSYEAKEFVEHLVERLEAGKVPDRRALKWLDDLPNDIHERLANAGLCERRRQTEMPTRAIAYMREYIKSRTDWKKSCNHKQSVDHLEAFLKTDVQLRSLTEGEAERFHRWMMDSKKGSPGLSANTAGQHIKRCRQMMRAAIKDRLLDSNPFTGVKIDLSSDKRKNWFMDHDAAIAILNACPDLEWKALFALCRWGGLRNPSETFALRWSDIYWDRGRFRVTSPKTAKSGKDERVVPLFPQVRQALAELRDEVKPSGSQPVISRYRDPGINLRRAFLRIVKAAGVAEFQKPFMALRASRRNELERSGKHAPHVLNEWFGHTGKVAEQFYLSVTDDDWKLAAGPVDQFVDPSPSHAEESVSITDAEERKESRPLILTEIPAFPSQYTPLDSNQ